jgi:hypothetical protein
VATHSPNESEAYEIAMRAFEKISRALGKNHIDTARALINLGVIMSCRGQLMKAQNLLSKAQFIYSKKLPINHPDLISSTTNLELIQRALEKGKVTDLLSRLIRKPYFRRYIPSPTL